MPCTILDLEFKTLLNFSSDIQTVHFVRLYQPLRMKVEITFKIQLFLYTPIKCTVAVHALPHLSEVKLDHVADVMW